MLGLEPKAFFLFAIVAGTRFSCPMNGFRKESEPFSEAIDSIDMGLARAQLPDPQLIWNQVFIRSRAYSESLSRSSRAYSEYACVHWCWFMEETAYLADLTKEPEEDTLKLAYVDALEDLQEAE